MYIFSLFVISDASGYDSGGDFEGAGDAGGASHIGNGRFASDESGSGEIFEADGEIGLSPLFIKREIVNADGSIFVDAISVSVFDAMKFGEVSKMTIVLI